MPWVLGLKVLRHLFFANVFLNLITHSYGLHHAKMSCTPPHTPLSYSKTGVYRGIHYFLIFVLKHRLWVLVRTASVRRF